MVSAGLVERLRRGGHVLYLRHTATEATQDAPTPDLSDAATQRNLSAEGRAQAREIGEAVRRLRIPIGEVLASPYRRTVETAELAFGRARPTRELLNEAYPGTDDDQLAAGLRRLLAGRPGPGVNTVLVSHGFNLAGATGLSSAEGEMFVFSPGSREPVARIGVDDWRSLKE
ncbi:histidine phosphatase family protein [Nonomuraea sp. SYSU D8015]|uniref:histidine phosphatase family protein n=1 Tax=Nonomuraea sp. SYSU D8015 TaxID=2593644 RepID=UPI00166097F8|nr:histidine phosphatase family protein [Nonomuraea sp. SYSU D8015]